MGRAITSHITNITNSPIIVPNIDTTPNNNSITRPATPRPDFIPLSDRQPLVLEIEPSPEYRFNPTRIYYYDVDPP